MDNSKPKPSPQLLLDLNKHLEVAGKYNPLEKVYVKMGKNSSEFLTFIVVHVLSNLNRLAFGKNLLKYNKSTGTYGPAMAKQRKVLLELISSSRFIDGHVFLIGIVTILRQFYENNYQVEFVEMFGACVFEMMEFNLW